MSRNKTSVLEPYRHALMAACLAVALGCSGSGDSGTGTAGTSGGSAGKGGSSATGGVTGSGGTVGAGGSGGTNDKGGSGGSSATAGTTGASGTTGVAGGSPGSGGDGGKAGTGVAGGSGGSAGRSGGTSGAAGAAGVAGGSGGSAGRSGGTSGAAGAAGAAGAGGAGGSAGAKMSAGCGKAPPTLKSATVGQATPTNSISVGGMDRQFLVRWPSNYANSKAYPLHIGLHGANGNLSENGRDNFGLWSLSNNSTIFVTLGAVSGLWSGARDLEYADAVIKQVESELCIDTSRVVLEGFSQGGAMSWFLTGSRPGVFRAVVGHSGGGVSPIPALSPVAYLGSLGTQEMPNNSQKTQTDQFAKVNGCTIETLPTADTGKHVCTAYKGCQDGFPVTWCSYDGGHGFQDTDSGSSTSWVPAAVWQFLMPLIL
jgi:poly(3-hydroxybutyrate) depolymerase